MKIYDTYEELVEVFPGYPSFFIEGRDVNRLELQRYGMYACVTYDWIKPLSKWLGDSKVLEVMSGAGWLSKALRDCGTDIIATDSKVSHQYWREYMNHEVTDIEELDACEAIRKYGKDVSYILMSWPPYDEADAYNVATTIKEVNPDLKIIYIGEDCGGCTASDEYFELVGEYNDYSFNETVATRYPRTFGINDYIVLHEVK